MSTPIPLPVRLSKALLKALPYPALMVGCGAFALLFSLYFIGAVILGNPEVYIWDSLEERAGFGIIVPLIPSFLLACFVAATRLNQEVYGYLYSQLDSATTDSALLDRYKNGRYWLLAALAGVLISLTNINWPELEFKWNENPSAFMESVSIVSGNFIIWLSVFVVLFFFLIEGHCYHKLGKKVPVDLYNLDRLNGFGRVSLAGFLMVMGALALSTFQSIDQEFSWQRYRNGIVIGIPASITLALLPCWSVHRRLRRRKRQHLIEINQAISVESKSLCGDELVRMNALLARKASIESVRTWPMDFSIFSRFILYVFIPPLAWIGAALMEIFLDSFLAG